MHEASIANSSNKYAARILSDKHWAVIEYKYTILEPFMWVQQSLEAEQYVTIRLVVPNSQALRLGLRDGIEVLQAELPAETHDVNAGAGAIVQPCSFVFIH